MYKCRFYIDVALPISSFMSTIHNQRLRLCFAIIDGAITTGGGVALGTNIVIPIGRGVVTGAAIVISTTLVVGMLVSMLMESKAHSVSIHIEINL